MKPSEWSEPQFHTQISEIERFRQVFAEMMESMASAEDGMLRGMFTRFITQLERYFELENTLMENSEFPQIDSHREEHHQMIFRRLIPTGKSIIR